MMIRRTRIGVAGLTAVLATLLAAGGLWLRSTSADDGASKGTNDAAVQRTRKQALMLDDLYKTAVVLITQNYVNKETDLSAGSAAAALLDAMKKKGHHEVRLLDATGSPYKEDNVAKDEFEKEVTVHGLATAEFLGRPRRQG